MSRGQRQEAHLMTTSQLRQLRADIGELVERHVHSDGFEGFRRYGRDPVGFIREVLGGEPWENQIEIALAARDSPKVAVRSGNSCGKDWVAARLALWWVYARGGLVLLTGPTDRQVREVLMHEVRQAWRPELPGTLYERGLRVEQRSDRRGIIAFTSSELSRLTGFHAPAVMAIITEAQGVEDFCYEAMQRCATGAEDRILVVGNPTAPSGRFYHVHQPRSG